MFSSICRIFSGKSLLCFVVAWMITNGWAYILLGIGLLFRADLLTGIATAYLGILWLPFTPEKIVTLAIAYRLRKLLKVRD